MRDPVSVVHSASPACACADCGHPWSDHFRAGRTQTSCLHRDAASVAANPGTIYPCACAVFRRASPVAQPPTTICANGHNWDIDDAECYDCGEPRPPLVPSPAAPDPLAEAIALLQPVLDDGGEVDLLAVSTAMHHLYAAQKEREELKARSNATNATTGWQPDAYSKGEVK